MPEYHKYQDYMIQKTQQKYIEQMFLKVWKNHGLQHAPKIQLIETKQIIPDKNLFGQSRFAENAFNVIIQLGMKAAPGQNHLKKESNENENKMEKNLDNVGNQEKMDTMGKSGEMNNGNEDGYSDDSASKDRVTSGSNVAAGESVATSADDKLELAIEYDVSGLNRERKNTNSMEEGHS